MEKRLKQFQHNLKTFRENRGFTQEELSEACGFSASYLGKIERGEKHPSLTSLFRIADALEVPAARLLRMEEPTEGDSTEQTSRSPSLVERSQS